MELNDASNWSSRMLNPVRLDKWRGSQVFFSRLCHVGLQV
jgi:hypothetical protein